MQLSGVQDTEEYNLAVYILYRTHKSATQRFAGHRRVHFSIVLATEKSDLAVCRTQKSSTYRCAGHRRVQLSDVQDTEEFDLAVCRTQKSAT